MSEAVPGKRVWLIVYDEDRPCKSYTNEDIHYYKEFVDLFSSRLKRRLYYEGMLNELTALKQEQKNGPRGHFLFYKGEKTMTKREKALWLQEHYKNYSLKWYLENDARLNAMFRKAIIVI